MPGKDDSAFYPEEVAQKYIDEDLQLIETGIPVKNYEVWLKNESGEDRFYNTNKYPLRDENDNIIGLVGIGRDITDVKLKSIELEKLLQIQTKLVELHKYYSNDITEFLNYTLKSVLSITKSEVGYILTKDEIEQRFILSAWQINSGSKVLENAQDRKEKIESLKLWNHITEKKEKVIIDNLCKHGECEELKDLLQCSSFAAIPIIKDNKVTAIIAFNKWSNKIF